MSTAKINALLQQLEQALEGEAEFADFFTQAAALVARKNHQSYYWGDRLLSFDKSAGFMDEPAFMNAYLHIRGSHLYDPYQSPHTIAWRLHTLVWAARQALRAEGDFVECGVFKGDMAWVVAQMVQFETLPRQFYLYDTFSGFSEKYSSADDYPDNPAFLEFAHRIYSDQSIYPLVKEKFKPYPNIHVVQGVVPDVFAQKMPERIAYMHIDLNSPAAEVGALEILFDRISPGGVVVFDDYGWRMFRKQKEAEDAFFAARGYRVLELSTGQGLVIK